MIAIRTAVAFCGLAILFGPIYTETGYDWVRHSVSELAGQATANAWIMRVGLVALGLAAVGGYLRYRRSFNIFFLLFGISIALTGVFPHKPFMAGRPYSVTLDQMHSLFASAGGICAVLAFVLLSVQAATAAQRIAGAMLAGLYTLLSAAMFIWPNAQGAFQRVIFGSFIVWMLAQPSSTASDDERKLDDVPDRK